MFNLFLFYFLHILGASLWVGIMLSIPVVASYIRKKFPKESREIIIEIGKKFRILGFSALGIQIVSGTIIGFHSIRNLFPGEYGKTLLIKISLFILLFILQILHEKFGQIGNSKISRIIGFISLFITIIILYLGISLRFGGL